MESPPEKSSNFNKNNLKIDDILTSFKIKKKKVKLESEIALETGIK